MTRYLKPEDEARVHKTPPPAIETSEPEMAPEVPKEGVRVLQVSAGNAAVGRYLRAQQDASSETPTSVSPDTQRRIDARIGSGSPLEPSLREEMEPEVGADLTGARLHSDSPSHDLADRLDATAFTQGRDVFLGAGVHPASR